MGDSLEKVAPKQMVLSVQWQGDGELPVVSRDVLLSEASAFLEGALQELERWPDLCTTVVVDFSGPPCPTCRKPILFGRDCPRCGPRPIGRPRLEVQAQSRERLAPWKLAGMSRATWYRRKREGENG